MCCQIRIYNYWYHRHTGATDPLNIYVSYAPSGAISVLGMIFLIKNLLKITLLLVIPLDFVEKFKFYSSPRISPEFLWKTKILHFHLKERKEG